MKKVLLAALCFFAFSACHSDTTYYSDGSFSQSYGDGNGNSTTYNSDGSFSQSYSYGKY